MSTSFGDTRSSFHHSMASDHLDSDQYDGRCTVVASSCRNSEIMHTHDPIHIPRAIAEGPFLQYPRLTPGQRCYLSSIASIYSVEHVRRLMQQHYLNVIYRCTQEDPCPFKESRSKEESMLAEECVRGDSAVTTGSRTPSKSRKDSSDSSLVAVNAIKVTLPKIPIKQARKASRPSKEKKTRKPKRSSNGLHESNKMRSKHEQEERPGQSF